MTSGVIQDVQSGKDPAFFANPQHFITDYVTNAAVNDRFAQGVTLLGVPTALNAVVNAGAGVGRGVQFGVLGGRYLYGKAQSARK